MKPLAILRWPPKCSTCGTELDEWGDVGVSQGDWFHKRCWLTLERRQDPGRAPLVTPLDGLRTGLPMIVFLLFFHFGGGAAVMGWFMLTQYGQDSAALITLLSGFAAFAFGLTGFLIEIVMRMRLETVRQTLDEQGGWQALGIE